MIAEICTTESLTYSHKLRGNRPGIVVGHAVMRFYGDIVARQDLLASGKVKRISLHDLFGERLGGARDGLLSREKLGSIGSALKLRVEGAVL